MPIRVTRVQPLAMAFNMVAPRTQAEIDALAHTLREHKPYMSAEQLSVLRRRKAKLKKRVQYVIDKINQHAAQRNASQLTLNI